MKPLLSFALLLAALGLAAPALSAQRGVYASDARLLRAPAYTHAPRRVWVPGHYETRHERVWVPGPCERVWIEPVFELRFDACGRRVRFEVSPGHWRTVQHPGHHEQRAFQVWVPGHYRSRERCD